MSEVQTNDGKEDDGWGYLFACCPKCRTTLVQAKNGMNGFIRCPQCGTHIHVIIKNGIVMIKRKN